MSNFYLKCRFFFTEIPSDCENKSTQNFSKQPFAKINPRKIFQSDHREFLILRNLISRKLIRLKYALLLQMF